MKTIDDKELARLAKNDLEVQLATEKLRVSAFKIKNMELTQKVISLEMAAEKTNLEVLRGIEAAAKIVRADELKIIAKKKKLKEGWGYNPDSGEIVEN
jgi:hypothetical protein